MEGKILKGIGGFYYVHVPEHGTYECRAKGKFRNQKIKPLIGDNVTIGNIDEAQKTGHVIEIHKRVNSLIRPTVANVDQILIVFAANDPKPSLSLLDRFLITIERAGIDAVICFNKTDRSTKEEIDVLRKIYEKSGYKVYLTSALVDDGLGKLEEILDQKTTAFAGPSGVGKSTILNIIQSVVELETGEISAKIGRGKHTTRHAELICFQDKSYVVDTPGFSNLDIEDILENDLKDYYIEFHDYEGQCKFNSCNHISEPDCAVKAAVEAGILSAERHESYVTLYNELKDIRRW